MRQKGEVQRRHLREEGWSHSRDSVISCGRVSGSNFRFQVLGIGLRFNDLPRVNWSHFEGRGFKVCGFRGLLAGLLATMEPPWLLGVLAPEPPWLLGASMVTRESESLHGYYEA